MPDNRTKRTILRLIAYAKRLMGRGKGRDINRDIDQWTAGNIVLHVIAQWVVNGADTSKVRELINELAPGDVIQTEHVIILATLRDLDAKGEDLSIGRLKSALAPHDSLGFAEAAWDSFVEDCQTAPSGEQELDRLLSMLERIRDARDKASLVEKRNAVKIGQRILERSLGVIEGARELALIANKLNGADRRYFLVFFKPVAAAHEFPEGQVRKYWADDSLAREDAERAQLEADSWPEVELACKTVIDLWGEI